MLILDDKLGRQFKTLRVSLINTCNLGCVYCTQGTAEIKQNYSLTKKDGLSASELSDIIAKLHQNLHLETIRFTGGEPLLYQNLSQIIRAVAGIGIKDLKLTTNGLLLGEMAEDLAKAGLKSLNVSLDAIDPDIFFKISRRNGLERIIKGIEKAIDCGMEVKLNSVIMRNLNECQILPLLHFAFNRNIKIRFLEIMAMGHLFGNSEEHFFSREMLLSVIKSSGYQFKQLPRKASSTATYWQTSKAQIFGVIANESEPFCGDCNRLRLDSMGNMYGCLSSNHPIPLRNVHDSDLGKYLQAAMLQKQSVKFTGSDLSMLSIGG